MSRVEAPVFSPCLLENFKPFFGTSIDLLKIGNRIEAKVKQLKERVNY